MGDSALGIAIFLIMLLGMLLYRLGLRLSDSLGHQRATRDVLRIVGHSTEDLDAVLRTLLSTSADICRADASGIVRHRASEKNVVASLGLPGPYESYLRQVPWRPDDQTFIGRTLSEGRTIHILDAHMDPALREAPERQWFRSWLGVPLIMNGKTIGVMVLARTTPSLSEDRKRTGNVTSRLLWSRNMPFSDDEVELVATFARHATIAIENARLFEESREQRRQLEFANSYKSRFLAVASHDLRQPLHALNLFLAQLENCKDTQERARLVDNMAASVSSMNDLFDALLDMAKLDAGMLEAKPETFSFADLTRRLEANFTATARNKGLRLRVASSDLLLRSDFVLLERILSNLIANSIQNTTSGGVVVGGRKRGATLRIDVCDTGPGILDPERQNIFSEFYQAGTHGRRRAGSLGLGLSIVERLARLLDHPLEVDSKPGRGTRFSIYVPHVALRGLAEPKLPPHHATETMSGVSLHGARIVVIEDDPMARDGIEGMLRNWGCTVATAATDDAALSQISSWPAPPDLIICDYHLGSERTGIDAVAKLRSELRDDIPAFLISGDTSPGRLRDAELSKLRILHKPLTPMALRAVVNRMLHRVAENPS